MSEIVTISHNGQNLQYNSDTGSLITPLDQQGLEFWVGEFVGFINATTTAVQELSSNPKYANLTKGTVASNLTATGITLIDLARDIAEAETATEAFEIAGSGLFSLFHGFSSAYAGTAAGAYLAAAMFGAGAPVWVSTLAGLIIGTAVATVTYYALEALSSYAGSFAGGLFDVLVAAFELANGLIDPIAIDLDGDGITTVDVSTSQVNFDLDNNGIAETTGWIEPEDGFIAYDANGDGVINDRSELFDTFSKLAEFDINGDGVLDANDVDTPPEGETAQPGFNDLRIWVDADQDGVTEVVPFGFQASLAIKSEALECCHI